MNPGLHVDKYQVAARMGTQGVAWSLAVKTEDGETHEMTIPSQADVPVLLALARGDETLYFDSENGTLSTGWNDPGS